MAYSCSSADVHYFVEISETFWHNWGSIPLTTLREGSKLGPVSFIIFINDLIDSMKDYLGSYMLMTSIYSR